jgi:hypothetical protein
VEFCCSSEVLRHGIRLHCQCLCQFALLRPIPEEVCLALVSALTVLLVLFMLLISFMLLVLLVPSTLLVLLVLFTLLVLLVSFALLVPFTVAHPIEARPVEVHCV